jgi:hypothetical protein
MTDKHKAISVADELCEKYSFTVLQLVASTLFQRTIEFKSKTKWMSSEDDLLSTFFYLSSKEELCEALQCTMESLYVRARMLGVVSPTFDTLSSYDLGMALSLFQEGKTQEEVLSLFGVSATTTPIRTLTLSNYNDIGNALNPKDSSQMELFE